jgi:uncharacterized protein
VKQLDVLTAALVVVGALNWGLVAIAEFDLVAALFGLDFGETNIGTRFIYGLVGLSGVYLATQVRAIRERWAIRREAVPA